MKVNGVQCCFRPHSKTWAPSTFIEKKAAWTFCETSSFVFHRIKKVIQRFEDCIAVSIHFLGKVSFEILELSSFTHKRDELQISQSFSQRKMACVIGKKTHLSSPAVLWWKVRSQPKQSQRLHLAHHLETQSSNKLGSTAIAVYLGNDQSHHDKGRGKKKYLRIQLLKEYFLSRGEGLQKWLQFVVKSKWMIFISWANCIFKSKVLHQRLLLAGVNNYLACFSCDW